MVSFALAHDHRRLRVWAKPVPVPAAVLTLTVLPRGKALARSRCETVGEFLRAFRHFARRRIGCSVVAAIKRNGVGRRRRTGDAERARSR